MDKNQRHVKIVIKRKELCDLLLACTVAEFYGDKPSNKWETLHNELKEQLDNFDRMHANDD